MAVRDQGGHVILCASPRCRPYLGRHQPRCAEDECRGCLARPAADGRNLCEICTRRLAEDAVTAADLWHELVNVLARPSAGREKTSGSKEHGTQLNTRAVAARTLIRHTLVSWCLLVAEDRGVATPNDTPTAMGYFLGRHAVWLSAHPAGGDCADEFRELAHGWPWRAAHPDPVMVAEVGPCPMPGCTGMLTGVFRSRDTETLPSTIECDWWADLTLEQRVGPDHKWTARQIHLLRTLLQSAGSAA